MQIEFYDIVDVLCDKNKFKNLYTFEFYIRSFLFKFKLIRLFITNLNKCHSERAKLTITKTPSRLHLQTEAMTNNPTTKKISLTL